MGKRVRLKRGDIYRFDLDETRYGLGQVVEPGAVFYTTVLRTPVLHDFSIDEIDTGDILLCGWTMDALLFHGRWHVVGNLPVPDDDIPKPCSKVGNEGKPWISDFRAKLLRPATPFEWESLDYHRSHAPIRYQNAFKAHHGLIPVEPQYDAIGIEHVRAQAAICSA
jgi:hypothetical protein